MARPRNFQETEVLNAVTELFWKKGFADTSITDLEQVTGLTRTSIYAAYENKKSLYHRALCLYQSQAFTYVQRIFDEIEDPIEAIKVLLTDTLQRAFNDDNKKGCFIANAAAEMYHNCELTTSFLTDNKNKFVQLIKDKLSTDVSKLKKELHPKVDVLAAFIFTSYSGYMIMLKNGGKKEEIFPAIDLLIDFITESN